MATIKHGREDGAFGLLDAFFGVGYDYVEVTLEDGTRARGKDEAEAIAAAAVKAAERATKS